MLLCDSPHRSDFFLKMGFSESKASSGVQMRVESAKCGSLGSAEVWRMGMTMLRVKMREFAKGRYVSMETLLVGTHRTQWLILSNWIIHIHCQLFQSKFHDSTIWCETRSVPHCADWTNQLLNWLCCLRLSHSHAMMKSSTWDSLPSKWLP